MLKLDSQLEVGLTHHLEGLSRGLFLIHEGLHSVLSSLPCQHEAHPGCAQAWTSCPHCSSDVSVPFRSWNAFHVCASSALKGCPGEAAAVWESLRQESRKAQFSGNLYDMCASRTTLPPTTVPAPQSPPTSDQTNQETLKGQAYQHSPTLATMLFPICSTLLVFKT